MKSKNKESVTATDEKNDEAGNENDYMQTASSNTPNKADDQLKTMPKCPQCGKEIGHLVFYEKVWERSKFSPQGDYESVSDAIIPCEDGSQTYDCPLCHKELFHKENDALEFLQGEADIIKERE